jgi:integrase
VTSPDTSSEDTPQPRARPGHARPFPLKDGRKAVNLHLLRSDGRSWVKRLYGRSDEEVDAKRDAFLVDYYRDLVTPDSSTRLCVVLDRWLDAKEAADDVAEQSVRVSTWIGYETHVRLHIAPFLGNRPVGQIDGPAVKAWLRDLGEKGISPAMRIKVLTSLSTAYKWAIGEGYVRFSPTIGIKPRRGRRPAIEPLSVDLLGKLLAAVKGHPLESLFTIAMTMGPRLGELTQLPIRDADRARRTITIHHTGSWAGGTWHLEDTKREASRRTIRLPDSVWDILEAHLDRRIAAGATANDLIWVRRTGNPLRGDGTGGVGDLFKRCLKRAGLPVRNFHQLRSLAASLLLSLNGGDYAEVAQILGHSTYRTTLDIYARLLPEVGARRAADVDALMRRLAALEKEDAKKEGDEGDDDEEEDEIA